MSDPLLTTLCSVCRAEPPKYKCPLCGVLYCSVPCNRRHKARAGCSGIRDVTGYVPRAKLCTPAGLIQDMGVLRNIELARMSAEKQVVEERRLLRSADLRLRVLGEEEENNNDNDDDNGQARRPLGGGRGGSASSSRRRKPSPMLKKEWRNGQLRFAEAPDRRGKPKHPAGAAAEAVAAAAAAAAAAGPGYNSQSSKVRTLCHRGNIELLCVPRGMARQRENSTATATTFPQGQASGAPRELHLDWQVEWLVYDDGQLAAQPSRALRRQLDHVPLFRGYIKMMDWMRRSGRRPGGGGGGTRTEHEEGETTEGDQDNTAAAAAAAAAAAGDESRPTPGTAPDGAGVRGPFCAYAFQDADTGAWLDQKNGGATFGHAAETSTTAAAAAAAERGLRYYLLRPQLPGTPATGRPGVKELIPLSATDTLATALRGRSVLEFPTIYVLPPADSVTTTSSFAHPPPPPPLPPKHVLGSTDRRPPAEAEATAVDPWRKRAALAGEQRGGKRSRGGAQTRGRSTAAAVGSGTKRRKTASGFVGAEEEEDDNDDDDDQDSETSSSGSDSSDDDDDDDNDDDMNEEEEEEEGEVPSEEDSNGELAGDGDGEGLALLKGIRGSRGGSSSSKPKLVVYDSWSEGSSDEGET